jgi:lysozyme family protein
MIRKSKRKTAFYLLALTMFLITGVLSPVASAQSDIYKTLDTPFYDPGSTITCSSDAGTAGSNTDYAGRPILNQEQLKAASQNQAVYQQAAEQVGIPWQVLAAIHYRETGLSLNAPSNGDGQYQIVKNSYPSSGTITQQEFLQESIDAANFIKSDGAGLTADSDTATIKKSMGLYNGLPDLYKQQAVNLGFGADQAYEGSPYVMNFTDAKRDPGVAPAGTWLQYLTSTTTGPANNQYGAYLIYASLSGMNTGGGCVSTVDCSGTNATVGISTTRQNIVCIAQQEYQKWTSGQLLSGTGYSAYSENRQEDWCADFASWVYDQAGDSLGPVDSPTNNWNVSYVPNLLAPPQDSTKFTVRGVGNYTPQPGDLAIHGDHHVNIVVGVSGSQITLVGGNQGSNDFNQSKVSSYSTDFSDGGDITNYVSPN